MRVVTGAFKGLNALQEFEGKVIFYLIIPAVGVGSVYLLFDSLIHGEPLQILIALLCLQLPVLVIYGEVKRRNFIRWLKANAAQLATHGSAVYEGRLITLDTQIVQYQLVFSALLFTATFGSRFYFINAGDKKGSYARLFNTLYTLLFGWWFAGLDGIANTIQALIHNLGKRKVITVRQLFR